MHEHDPFQSSHHDEQPHQEVEPNEQEQSRPDPPQQQAQASSQRAEPPAWLRAQLSDSSEEAEKQRSVRMSQALRATERVRCQECGGFMIEVSISTGEGFSVRKQGGRWLATGSSVTSYMCQSCGKLALYAQRPEGLL